MTYTLLAQDPAAPAPAGGKGQQEVPFFMSLPFMMLMMGLFFLVVMLPAQRRQRREQQHTLASIKRGAKVVTNGGIIGTVVNVKDTEDEVTLRSEDTKLKVLKSSIARVLGQDENEGK
jgi:preprotein translocase subunit YajC